MSASSGSGKSRVDAWDEASLPSFSSSMNLNLDVSDSALQKIIYLSLLYRYKHTIYGKTQHSSIDSYSQEKLKLSETAGASTFLRFSLFVFV